MKEEVSRILKLVAEGKLSPEDASDLIDAFQGDKKEEEAAAPPKGAGKDPFKGFVDFLENVEKDITQHVDWKGIAASVKEGAQKGVEAIKKAADEAKSGNFSFFFSSEVREIVLPLSIGEGKLLKIENPCGDVKVVGGAAEPMVTAKAKFRGNTPEEAKQRAEGFTLAVEESDHTTLIRQNRQTWVAVDFVVEVPAGVACEIVVDSGDLSVQGCGANVKIVSQSGDVHIEGANGLIELSTQAGDVNVSNSTVTTLSIESRSGDILMKDVTGSINARVASGDVHVQGWKGKTLAVESVSGDVRASFGEAITGQATIRTVTGSTSVSVVDGNDCRVSLSAIRGDVSCGLALEDEAKTDHLITGRMGAGTGSLEVSSINGDINLRLVDSSTTATSES